MMFGRLFALLTLVSGDDELVLVKTSTGWIRGIEKNGVVGFLGVPYASPPTDALRFSMPVPHPAWDDDVVRNATHSGPTCVQGSEPTGEEDCLVLNVFTTRSKVPRPVVFDVHGGGFVSGSAKNDSFSWKSVVLVAPQYRLGVFGFACNDVCENFGLADQRLALLWTAANAEALGGDPSRILIMGGSAGGASVAGMLLSPEVSGLFHAASLESPGGHQGWMGNDRRTDDDWMSQALRVNHTKRLLSSFFGPERIEDLRGVDAATLWLKAKDMRLAPSIVDEYGRDDYPLRKLRHGQWTTKVPVIIGGVSCESCSIAEEFLGPPRDNVTRSEFLIALGTFLDDAASPLTAIDVEAWYVERIHAEGRWRTFARILSDSGHACSSALHALAFANSTKTWRYFFSYTDTKNDPLPGATHGSEHLYILDEQQPDALSNAMANWWANFATTADPNFKGDGDNVSVPFWSSYDNDSSLVMYMNATPGLASSMEDTERPECLRHWAHYLGW